MASENGLRLYQLPQAQYALVLDVRERLGADVGAEVERVLCNRQKGLNLPSDQMANVKRYAAARGVELPA